MKSSEKASLLHVAFPSNATMQQPPQNDATSNATSTQHLTVKPASLLDLARNRLRNNHATSPLKTVQQAPQKMEVVVAHENEAIDEPLDLRQQRVLELLQSNPELKYAVVVDDTNTDPVTVTVGIRKIAVFDLEIPRKNYDGMALLQVIEQYAEEMGGNTQTSAS
jgi:hypothetical protein